MKRILAVHQSSEMYGSDRSFLAALCALASPDVEVTSVLPGPGPLATALEKAGVNIVYQPNGYLRRSELRRPVRFAWSSATACISMLRLYRNFDTVYVNTIVCLSAIASLIFFKGRKIIHVREIPLGLEARVLRLFLKLSGAKLIYNSKATGISIGLPGDVIYNGVAMPAVGSSEQDEAARPIRLLLLGRISSWKGQNFLLSSLSHVARTCEVRIVGSPIDSQKGLVNRLERQAVCLAPRIGVEFFDFTDDPSVHLAWSDYVIVPSLKPEPFGRVAIEGLSFGKPVVGASHGGLLEIIRDGETGFLFKPGSESDLAQIVDSLPQPGSADYRKLSDAAILDFGQRFSLSSYQRAVRRELLGTVC